MGNVDNIPRSAYHPSELAEIKDSFLSQLSPTNNNVLFSDKLYKTLELEKISIVPEEFNDIIRSMADDGNIIIHEETNGKILITRITAKGRLFRIRGGYTKEFQDEWRERADKKVKEEKQREKLELELTNLRADKETPKSERINSIIWKITPIIISIGSLVLGWSNTNRINKHQYELNSINYKPQLEISSKITNFKFTSVGPYFEATNSAKESKLLGTKGNFTAKIDITFKNIGNENAYLLLSSYSDTTSNIYLIRNMHEKRLFPESFATSQHFLHDDIQISPKNEYHLTFEEAKTNNFRDNKYQLYFWTVYKNDLGMLYDTFFTYSAMLSDSTLSAKGNNVIVIMTNSYERNKFYPYSEDESKRMKKFITGMGQLLYIK